MKALSILFVLGAATFGQASRLPTCSAVCLTEAIAATGCKASNTQCICTSETFLPTVSECVEKSCNEADKEYTLEVAGSFCVATGAHTQLMKRDALPEPEPELDSEAEPLEDELESRSLWRGGWRHRGWRRPKHTESTRWVPNFSKDGSEWWKGQSTRWWKANGYDWWSANGHHFPGPKWWQKLSPTWWRQNGGQWRAGPSGGTNGPQKWWPAPVKTWPSSPPIPVTVTVTSPPGPTQTHPGGGDHNPPRTTPPPQTHTAEPWTSYTTSAPVQTVIPGKGW